MRLHNMLLPLGRCIYGDISTNTSDRKQFQFASKVRDRSRLSWRAYITQNCLLKAEKLSHGEGMSCYAVYSAVGSDTQRVDTAGAANSARGECAFVFNNSEHGVDGGFLAL